MSGSLVSRPGMQAMLTFLKKHRAHEPVVLIDDISRLARGVKAHIELRGAISLAGGQLESPTAEFRDDADGELQEFILATVAQHQRKKNAEQTKNRMRARVLNGYWPFACPVGYRYQKVNGHGKLLVRAEPEATILQEALEGFASGRFQSQAEVKRFLEAQPEYPKYSGGIVPNWEVTRLLTRSLYAGFVEAPKWDVSLRKGHHAGLISAETFQRNQERLAGGAYVPARKDIKSDFPLRGFVLCGDCNKPLTACWSKGRTSRFPYYLCPNTACASYRKSIRRDALEGAFEELLTTLQPTQALFTVARAMLEDLWNFRLRSGEARSRGLKAEAAKAERMIEQLLDRIVQTDMPSVISAYENRIRKLEVDRAVINEKIAKCGRPLRTLEETVRTALDFIEKPCKLWVSERLEDKRAVLKLAFSKRLVYCRKRGFRTADLAFPFKALAAPETLQREMARQR